MKNGEISSIDEGIGLLSKAGICYYEVFDDSISSLQDEEILMSALTKYGSRVGNLYFKRDIYNTDEKTIDELFSITVEKLRQCTRLRCKKLMPVITVHSDNLNDMSALREYFRAVSEISNEYDVLTVFENGTNEKNGTMTMSDVNALLQNADKLNYLLDAGNFLVQQ